MKQQPTISQDFFEELLKDAIGDLQKSGLTEDQGFLIIRDLFGLDYADRFCRGHKINFNSRDHALEFQSSGSSPD